MLLNTYLYEPSKHCSCESHETTLKSRKLTKKQTTTVQSSPVQYSLYDSD